MNWGVLGLFFGSNWFGLPDFKLFFYFLRGHDAHIYKGRGIAWSIKMGGRHELGGLLCGIQCENGASLWEGRGEVGWSWRICYHMAVVTPYGLVLDSFCDFKYVMHEANFLPKICHTWIYSPPNHNSTYLSSHSRTSTKQAGLIRRMDCLLPSGVVLVMARHLFLYIYFSSSFFKINNLYW